jgi:hypothetical protein
MGELFANRPIFVYEQRLVEESRRGVLQRLGYGREG